jgi:quercetin dioxygenase-like cupin family protein
MSIRSLCVASLLFAGACAGEMPEDQADLDQLETAGAGVTGVLRGRGVSFDTEIETKWEDHDSCIESESDSDADGVDKAGPCVSGDGGVYWAYQDVIFAPGGHTGWHTHAGPVFALVQSGTLTMYGLDDSDPCATRDFHAGDAFIDGPGIGDAHLARNVASSGDTVVQLLHLLPTATTPFRIDRAAPATCF